MVAKYEYDVWGNVLTVSNASNQEITDPNHIANLNPFRYRSYYYDSESGLYYLMSRYYDPVVHRFLNADGIDTPGIEAHAGSSYTLTWESTKFNVFDIAEDIDKSIEEW